MGFVSHKLTAYLSIFNLFKPNKLWSYYQPKTCKPDNLESHNSLQLCSNLVDCESFLESYSPDILALCDTNLDDWTDSGNFSVRGYLPLIGKDSTTHKHGLAVDVKEGLCVAWDLSLENSADSYLCFWPALLQALAWHPCCHLCKSRKRRLGQAMKSLPKGKAAWADIACAKF